MDFQPLIQLLARARANRIIREAQKSAAQVLEHQDGGAPGDPPRKETHDAVSL